MTRLMKHLPPLEQLKVQLDDPKILKIYSKYEAFTGPYESIEYLMNKLGVDLEPENNYIE